MILLILSLLSLFVNQGYVYAGDIKGKVLIQGGKGVKDAVVYIDEVPGGKFSPPGEPAVMDQRNLRFIPHVLPILVLLLPFGTLILVALLILKKLNSTKRRKNSVRKKSS